MKILIIVQAYAQISETYIKTEIDRLAQDHEIEIIALSVSNCPYRHRRPHIQITPANEKNVIEYIKGFKPDIIHGHYLITTPVLLNFSRLLNVPFTVRSHSFDVLELKPEQLKSAAAIINDEHCIGMLGFPFLRKRFEMAGINPEKIVDCFPVVNYPAFLDPSPNGHSIMNVGAALPKKNMEDFLRLSTLLPGKEFNLYALGYDTENLKAANQAVGGRVNFITPVEPDDMPQHYKKHEWMVYTASAAINIVGWPLAIAEAQAAGVGVCVQKIRPDLQEYVGDAGFLFSRIEEAAEIIARPFPAVMRERGFELAKRSDINNHISLLTDLWK